MGFTRILTTQFKKDVDAANRGEPTELFHFDQENPLGPKVAPMVPFAKAVPFVKQKLEHEQKQTGGAVPAPQKTAPQKAKPAPAIQKQGRVPTVKRKRQSRGRTIMGPLASKNEGSTYRKKLLGE